MANSYLADLINKQVQASLVSGMSRHVDGQVDELVKELLKDPDFKTQMLALVRVAFEKALHDLSEESS